MPVFCWPETDGLELWVIEDSDEDRGVARSFAADYRLPLRVVFEYLTWARNQSPKTLYHSFGASDLAAGFDYAAAYMLLEDFWLKG